VAEVRRNRREAAAARPETVAPADQMTGRELMAAFDEELEKLPPRWREALVLCCLEGLTRDEAAARLGVPVRTLKGRIERGRKKLGDALTPRGCSLGIGLLATLATTFAGAAPPKLFDSILAAVAGSPSPAARIQGVAMNGLLAQAKLAAFAVVGATMVGVATFSGPAVGQSAPKIQATVAPVKQIAAQVPPRDNKASANAVKDAAEVLGQVKGESLARCRLWCQVADLRRKLGDRDGAFEALRTARDVADEMKGPSDASRCGEWRGIGQGYGRLGDAKTVLDLAAAVPEGVLQNGYPRDAILQESAWAAAEAGHATAAEEICAAIPDEKMKKWIEAESRRLLILHRARGGDVAGAIKVAVELPMAEEKIIALVGSEYLNLAFDDRTTQLEEGIVAVQLANGDRPGAKASAMKALSLLSAAGNDRRALAATSVVRALCKLHDLPAARKAVELVPPKPADWNADNSAQLKHWWDLKAKAYLATAETRAGNDQAALALAKDFTRPDDQAHIFQCVALA
jgi:hypothetical protein